MIGWIGLRAARDVCEAQPFALSLETQQVGKEKKKGGRTTVMSFLLFQQKTDPRKEEGRYSNVKHALRPMRFLQFRDSGVWVCEYTHFIKRQNLSRRQPVALSQ